MSEDDLIELFRSQDVDALKQVIAVLDGAGIGYHLIADEGGFDLTSIGSGDDDSERVINIERSNFEAARTLLEEDCLKADLPKDHHLLHSSDEELIEVVTHASEWSAFDTAHARRLLGERGVDVKKLEEERAARVARLRAGQPGPKGLILFGWVFSILGGLIGIAVAYSLMTSKVTKADGEFLKYDEVTRKIGGKMFKVAVIVAVISVILRFTVFAKL